MNLLIISRHCSHIFSKRSRYCRDMPDLTNTYHCDLIELLSNSHMAIKDDDPDFQNILEFLQEISDGNNKILPPNDLKNTLPEEHKLNTFKSVVVVSQCEK